MNNGIKIEGESFTLRSWQKSDRESLAHHADNVRIARNMRDMFPNPYTLQDAKTFIEMASTKFADTYFAIEVDGQAVGGIGFVPGADVERLNAEVGYWLGEQYWGRGIMPEAVKLLARHIFDTRDIIRLHAGIYEYNRPSMRVLEKAGFSRVGTMHKAVIKHGRIIDLEYYELIKPGI